MKNINMVVCVVVGRGNYEEYGWFDVFFIFIFNVFVFYINSDGRFCNGFIFWVWVGDVVYWCDI